MNAADVATVIGHLFGAYGIGWTMGYLLLTAVKLLEHFR